MMSRVIAVVVAVLALIAVSEAEAHRVTRSAIAVDGVRMHDQQAVMLGDVLPTPPNQGRMSMADGVAAKTLWSETETYAVYTTAGAVGHPVNGSSTQPPSFSLGTWLNPPCEAYALDQTGKHIFDFSASSPNAQFDIATARHIDTYPVGDVDIAVAEFSGFFDRPYSCSVFGFASTGKRAGPTPIWQYDIPACEASMLDTDRVSIVMSDDGSTVAFQVASNRSTTGGSDFTTPSPQLYVLDGQTGKLLFVYDLRSQGQNVSLSGVSISRRGEWVAWSNTVYTYVVQRDGKLRTPPINKGVDAATHICPMGTFIAWGFTDAHVAKWNATSGMYEDKFVFPGVDEQGVQWYVTGAVTTINGGGSHPDGCLVAFGFTRSGGARQVRVAVYHMFTGKRYWAWTSPIDTNVQTEAYLSFHMGFLAVAHWGNDDATAPQTLLFGLASATPLFTFVSPGSMFSVDVIAPDAPIPTFNDYLEAPAYVPAVGAQNVYVTSSGKHVHASQMGNGGDAYAFLVTVS